MLVDGLEDDCTGNSALLRRAMEEGCLIDRQGNRLPLGLVVVRGERWGESVTASHDRKSRAGAVVVPFAPDPRKRGPE